MYVCIGMCFCIGVCKFGNIQMLCELIAIDLAFIWPSVQVFAIAADARAPRHAGPPFALPLHPPPPPPFCSFCCCSFVAAFVLPIYLINF